MGGATGGVQKAFCHRVCMDHFALSVIAISIVIAKYIYIVFLFLKGIFNSSFLFAFVLFYAFWMEDDN